MVRWNLVQRWGTPGLAQAQGELCLCEDGTLLVSAPCAEDPAPPGQGSYDGLWNFEVVELFLGPALNAEAPYLEIEIGRHGHWLVLEMASYRERAALIEDAFSSYKVTEGDGTWQVEAKLSPRLWERWKEVVRWGYASAVRMKEGRREYWVSESGALPSKTPDFHALGLRRELTWD